MPIGHCRTLAQQIDAAIPTLTNPSVNAPSSKLLLASKNAKSGLIVTYLPSTAGDPIQVNQTRKFHIRIGDGFPEMPYETLKRMFLGSQAPELLLVGPNDPEDEWFTPTDKRQWPVPIILRNMSSATARDIAVMVTFGSEKIDGASSKRPFSDVSALNPGELAFNALSQGPIHRGMDNVLGNIQVKLREGATLVQMTVEVYADRMRARQWVVDLRLAKSGVVSGKTPEYTFLY